MAAEVLRAQYPDLRRLQWTREIETSQKKLAPAWYQYRFVSRLVNGPVRKKLLRKSLRLLGTSTGLYPDLLVVYHITTLFLFKYVRQSLSLSPPPL